MEGGFSVRRRRACRYNRGWGETQSVSLVRESNGV